MTAQIRNSTWKDDELLKEANWSC